MLFRSILAVITSIDREHLDCYGSLEELRHAYAEFANKVPFYGAAIVCLDDENVRLIVPQLRRRIVSYGMEPGVGSASPSTLAQGGERQPNRSPQADLIAESVECGHFQSRFHLRYHGEDLGGFELRVPGRHNVSNATAAAAVCLELKIEVETIRAALAEFAGVERRFQVRGMVGGVTVVDDYGHHPTEIRATLAAARDCGYARVLAVFQPHRYTRTALLLDEFGPSFDAADAVFVLDIYPAGEPPIEGISSETLVERMRAGARGTVEYQSRVEDVLQKLLGQVQPGDLVLTLGAGNVWQVGERFLELLRERSTKVQAVSSRA